MNVEEILDMLDEMLDRAWNLPMTGGRCVLDAEKVRDMIDDIRANMPAEVEHAKKIVADRAEIVAGQSVRQSKLYAVRKNAQRHWLRKKTL